MGRSTHPLRGARARFCAALSSLSTGRLHGFQKCCTSNLQGLSSMLKVAHKRRIQDSIVLEDSCADLCVRKLPYSVYVLFHLGTRSLVSPLMRMMLAALFCNALDKFDAANAGTLWCTCPGPQCKHNVRAVVQCGSSRSLPDALSLKGM